MNSNVNVFVSAPPPSSTHWHWGLWQLSRVVDMICITSPTLNSAFPDPIYSNAAFTILLHTHTSQIQLPPPLHLHHPSLSTSTATVPVPVFTPMSPPTKLLHTPDHTHPCSCQWHQNQSMLHCKQALYLPQAVQVMVPSYSPSIVALFRVLSETYQV